MDDARGLPTPLEVARVPLPEFYLNARRALADCLTLSESVTLRNQVEAVITYARMVWATRRCSIWRSASGPSPLVAAASC